MEKINATKDEKEKQKLLYDHEKGLPSDKIAKMQNSH